jgi:hypothetical protein
LWSHVCVRTPLPRAARRARQPSRGSFPRPIRRRSRTRCRALRTALPSSAKRGFLPPAFASQGRMGRPAQSRCSDSSRSLAGSGLHIGAAVLGASAGLLCGSHVVATRRGAAAGCAVRSPDGRHTHCVALSRATPGCYKHQILKPFTRPVTGFEPARLWLVIAMSTAGGWADRNSTVSAINVIVHTRLSTFLAATRDLSKHTASPAVIPR